MSWPNLPEDYGNGQRLFDVAYAINEALRPVAGYAALISGVATYQRGLGLLAVPAAVGVYVICTWGSKKRLAEARKAWEEDIRLYREHLTRIEN